ncbi:kelch-like protein 13 isoform X2 [Lineus longissimus]|uniref:kelch-like protein 13 isoform X2 n=1 Tax=Lineus longissimus TaxID=88925 RepID=UPI00315CEAEE
MADEAKTNFSASNNPENLLHQTPKSFKSGETMPGPSRKRSCLSPLPATSRGKTLFSENYGTKILLGLRRLRQTDILCDLVLKAENKNLKVHRAVMAACSDYFRAMLTSDMVEKTQECIDLKGISGSGLEAVVQFAYSGVLQVTSNNAEDVMAAASHLQISEAVDLCCEYLESAITVGNCVDILNLAELYSLHQTKSKAREFILENFVAFAESDQYFKLTSSQLSLLLEENGLKVVTEFKLFELVQTWVNFDPKGREHFVTMLMSKLRLPLLSGEELVEKVSKVEIMQAKKECTDLLTEAKDYHIVVSKQPRLQSPRTQVRSNTQSLVMCHAEYLESYNLTTKKHSFLRDSTVPLYNPCVCVVNNFMYACGGKYDSNENNEIATARCFRYDPRFDSWYELAAMSEARKDFALMAIGDILYGIGGQDENMVMCSVEAFSIEENEWELKAPLIHATYDHAATMCQKLIYLSGGQRFDGFSDQMVCYDAASNIWTEKTPMFASRSKHIMATVKDEIFVVGGNIEDSYGFPVNRTMIECYHPVRDQWTVCSSTLTVREAGACVHDKKIYIVGGINVPVTSTDPTIHWKTPSPYINW